METDGAEEIMSTVETDVLCEARRWTHVNQAGDHQIKRSGLKVRLQNDDIMSKVSRGKNDVIILKGR